MVGFSFSTTWYAGPTPLRIERTGVSLLLHAGPTRDKVTLIVAAAFSYLSFERLAFLAGEPLPRELSASAVGFAVALVLFGALAFICPRAILNAFIRRERLLANPHSFEFERVGLLGTRRSSIRVSDVTEVGDAGSAVGFRLSNAECYFGWDLHPGSVELALKALDETGWYAAALAAGQDAAQQGAEADKTAR